MTCNVDNNGYCSKHLIQGEYKTLGGERWCENGLLEMSDATKLTLKLVDAGADRAKVIAIVDGYGDPVDWSYHSLDSIIAEVWQSDTNSGEDPEGWIINEICRQFGVEEVTE